MSPKKTRKAEQRENDVQETELGVLLRLKKTHTAWWRNGTRSGGQVTYTWTDHLAIRKPGYSPASVSHGHGTSAGAKVTNSCKPDGRRERLQGMSVRQSELSKWQRERQDCSRWFGYWDSWRKRGSRWEIAWLPIHLRPSWAQDSMNNWLIQETYHSSRNGKWDIVLSCLLWLHQHVQHVQHVASLDLLAIRYLCVYQSHNSVQLPVANSSNNFQSLLWLLVYTSL